VSRGKGYGGRVRNADLWSYFTGGKDGRVRVAVRLRPVLPFEVASVGDSASVIEVESEVRKNYSRVSAWGIRVSGLLWSRSSFDLAQLQVGREVRLLSVKSLLCEILCMCKNPPEG
jgi:hypothetical protein